MYHLRFKGAHQEIGRRFGAGLAAHGQYLLNCAPYPITEERRAFARSCLPVYQEFFPEVLDEIQGISEGQRCEAEALQALLFSMYAIPPACGCSCFAVSEGESILLGRNSDFLTALEKLNANVIYRFSEGAYSFTGNTTAFIEMEDGANEKGLAVGLTAVFPAAIKPGFNAGMLMRFFLEKCQSTEEVIRQIERLPISSAQTIIAADAQGSIVLIECCAQKTAVIRPVPGKPFVCAVNQFQAEEMQPFLDRTADSWQSPRRYDTLIRRLSKGSMGIQSACELLAGKEGFLCQYDRKSGQDTVWSVVYDLKRRAIYRAEGNPGRKGFKADGRFWKN